MYKKKYKNKQQESVRYINLEIQQNKKESLEKRDSSRSNESKVYDYKDI